MFLKPQPEPLPSVKTYEIANRYRLSQRYYDILENGARIMYVITPRKTHDQRPQVMLYKACGGLLGAAEIRRVAAFRELKYLLGNTTLSHCWLSAYNHGLTGARTTFYDGGKEYEWVRMHDKTLGASRWKTRCLKLVERDPRSKKEKKESPIEEKVLMAWIQTHSVLKGRLHQVANVHIYVDDMADSLQNAALIVALGLREQKREARRQAFRDMQRYN